MTEARVRHRWQRRWLWLGAAGVAVVLTAAVVITTTRGDGPAQQFERSAKTFHDQYRSLSDQLARDLTRAGDGFGEPGFAAAQLDVRKLGDAFDAYDEAVTAIRFPDQANAAAKDLLT